MRCQPVVQHCGQGEPVEKSQPVRPLYGAIEGGGTKFVCAIGHAPYELIEHVTVPTTDAPRTLAACVEFFAAAEKKHGRIAAFGFACFGPLELRRASDRYGHLLSTPKPGWSGVDLLAPFRSAFGVPIELDTDVAAAALAEWKLGAGRGLGSLAYITVGTGIGGAIAPQDATAARLMHAEMGHLLVRRDPRDAAFMGICPFHGDCLEGLASGTAIAARWGQSLDAFPIGHDANDIVGGYLGQLAASISLIAPVERIVFGGGVMAGGTLLPHIRSAAFGYLNGYLQPLTDERSMDTLICPPGLEQRAGVCGALLLAQRALEDNH
jgi:fructokinase